MFEILEIFEILAVFKIVEMFEMMFTSVIKKATVYYYQPVSYYYGNGLGLL